MRGPEFLDQRIERRTLDPPEVPAWDQYAPLGIEFAMGLALLPGKWAVVKLDGAVAVDRDVIIRAGAEAVRGDRLI